MRIPAVLITRTHNRNTKTTLYVRRDKKRDDKNVANKQILFHNKILT